MKHRLLCPAVVAWIVGVVFSAGVPAGEAAPPASQLLGRYQPVTQLDPLERFLPTKVQSFVSDTDLEQLVAGNWTVVDTDPEPGKLPELGTWRLNQDSCSPSAFLGGLDCYASASATGSGGSAVYGRVTHEDGRRRAAALVLLLRRRLLVPVAAEQLHLAGARGRLGGRQRCPLG